MGSLALLLAASLASFAFAQDRLLPPGERLVPVPARDVQLAAGSFWGPRLATNALVSLQHGAEMLEKHGQFGNFRLAAAALGHAVPGGMAPPAEHAGVHFYDSDAYKWLEACCLALEQPALADGGAEAAAARADLRARVDRFVEEIAAAQRDDGYIQTQYVIKAQEPWSNLHDDHELYCAGHLIQAAIAHERATGSPRLMQVALRFADLIDRTFGPDTTAGERAGACGHPGIETALVQLSDHTGERRWLDLAAYFLEARGQGLLGRDELLQDHAPIREQRTATGHAVRQLYLCSGVLGVAARTGDAGLLDANLAIWDDIVRGKLYVTGGLGARADGEAFGAPFELPNERAYSETCASIAWMRWNHELLSATGDARYADALETTLFNAFLASVGQDGRSWFYVNPLESRGGHVRQPWFWCACCPPNVMRTLAGLPGWFASTTMDTLWIHLHDDFVIDTTLGDGRRVKVAVEYDDEAYGPGSVSVWALEVPEGPFKVALRKPTPRHAREGQVPAGPNGYDVLEYPPPDPGAGRDFWYGLALRFLGATARELEPHFVEADPRVHANEGRVALRAGAFVYAFEAPAGDGDLFRTTVEADQEFEPPALAEQRDGREIRVQGVLAEDGAADALYRRFSATRRPVTLRALPYHEWAQRGDSAMRVWMPVVSRASTFEDDVAFLREAADVVVLQAEGAGPVAVSAKLSGRVMTSAFAEGEPGFGLLDRDAIRAGPVTHGFANYGGEDRLWLSPEGGPHGLFFPRGAPQTPETWSVPAWMDGQPRGLVRKEAARLEFDRSYVEVPGATGSVVVQVDRVLEALSRAEVEALLGLELDRDLRLVAFRSRNTLTARGDAQAAGALVGLWVLGQFTPSDRTTVLFPFRGDAAGPGGSPQDAVAAALKRDYFGEVPDERLAVLLPAGPEGHGHARFHADSRLRSKIGLSRAGATGWVGAFDEDRAVLTLVNHTLPPAGAPVPDCDWRVPNPRAAHGDVAASYNHGEAPRFFELESLSAALPAGNGARIEHVHTTLHLGGEREALAEVARAVLHAEP